MDNKIKQWAIDRNLHTEDPSKQFLKLVEELGELASAMARSDKELIDDSIGDIHVVLTIMKMQLENCEDGIETDDNFEVMSKLVDSMRSIKFDLSDGSADEYSAVDMIDDLKDCVKYNNITDTPYDECVLSAYNEIKDRKGKMVNGVFVKESDLSV